MPRVETFPLVVAVEALTEKGYVVLTPDQAEEVTAVVGAFAFADVETVLDKIALRGRAEALLAEWPAPPEVPA